MANKRKVKFADDIDALTRPQMAVGLTATAVVGTLVIGAAYAGLTPGGKLDWTKKSAETHSDVIHTGEKHIITAKEFAGLAKELKDPFGAGEFQFGEVAVDAAKELHGKVIMKVDNQPVEKSIEILEPAKSQAFLQDLLDTKDHKVSDVHVVPADGNIVLTGKDAQAYALSNLKITDAGNVSKIVVKANRDYIANTSVGAAKVYFDSKVVSKPIALDGKQIDAAFDVFENGKAGDLAKIVGKDKAVAKIGGFDVQAYVTMTNYAENKLGLGDQWGNGLETVLTNIEQHFRSEEAALKDTSASAFVNGTWDSVYLLADNVAKMTGKNATEIANNVTKFNETKDKIGAVGYLMGIAHTWADAKADGLVDPAVFKAGWISPSDANGATTNATNAILNTWRNDIWTTYSDLNGTNYLAVKYNITDKKQLNDKNADMLWNISQELLQGVSYSEGKKAGLTEVLLQQGNADALVLGAGSDGVKLDNWLDLIGQSGRFDFTFDHSANGTDAYNNFTQAMKEANVTLPANLTVKYDLNRWSYRITDTVDSGSMLNFYNKNGGLLISETRILNKDQTNFAKTWAKDYKVWSGPTEDE
jgi:hypothetical protein